MKIRLRRFLCIGGQSCNHCGVLDSHLVENIKMAKDLAGIVYGDDERKALRCLVNSMFATDLN
jgi:hypothetical protein